MATQQNTGTTSSGRLLSPSDRCELGSSLWWLASQAISLTTSRGVADLVGYCGSFLTVRQGIGSFSYLSAKEYFIIGNGQRVFDGPVTEEQERVAYCLLNVVRSTLQRDMCGLQKLGARTEEAAERIQNSILLRIAHACEY